MQEIRARIDTYFALVIRSVRDSIPKAVGFFLVKKVQECMQIEMLAEINKRSKLIESLGEPPHVRHEREHLSKMVDTMRKALRVLQRDPDLSAAGGIDEMDLGPPGPSSSSSSSYSKPASSNRAPPSYNGGNSGGYNPNVSVW